MEKLKSRKFILTAVMALITICNDGLGLNLPQDSIMTVAGLVVGYVMSQGYVDGQAVKPSHK